MDKDLIVEEIHEIREKLMNRQDGDLHEICELIRKTQEEEGRKTVSRPARTPVIQPAAA